MGTLEGEERTTKMRFASTERSVSLSRVNRVQLACDNSNYPTKRLSNTLNW